MRVFNIEVISAGESCQLQARVESDREEDHDEWFEPFVLWMRFPGWCQPFLSAHNGDPFLAALLLPAMRVGEPLRLPVSVSPVLLGALPEIQAIYAAFDPRSAPVPVEAAARIDPQAPDGGVPRCGLFFSMGVDSYYSLLKNQRDHPSDDLTVTHLISVHGFDIAHNGWSDDFPPLLLAGFERAAHETGKTLTPVVTNLRQVGARLAPWTMLHGGAMASIALALGPGLGRVLIAASTTYDSIAPWGTHPVLDPLWSTGGLRVVHDGCEMGSIETVRFIAESPLVLETLRVCPGFDPGYNCGRCMKCLRTMIALLQAGRLEQCRTLPHDINADALRVALRVPGGAMHRANFRNRLDSLAASGMRPDLQTVMAEHLATLEAEALSRSRTALRPSGRTRWRQFLSRWRGK